MMPTLSPLVALEIVSTTIVVEAIYGTAGLNPDSSEASFKQMLKQRVFQNTIN